jgi:ABC-type Mn2+/Zn2+ transport system permease subunit
MMPARTTPATFIGLICGIFYIILSFYLDLPNSIYSVLALLAIVILVSIFLEWKYPRLRYWYRPYLK